MYMTICTHAHIVIVYLLLFMHTNFVIVIVCYCFRQAIIISLLVKLNVIKQSVAWEKYGFQDVANSIQVPYHVTTSHVTTNHVTFISLSHRTLSYASRC